jgi:ribonuclease Z
LKIISYSTALYSTWIYIEDYNLLFDAGDGLSSGLNKTLGKIKNVFISHADRDHLSGLLQFNQMDSIHSNPNIYYPKDCASFYRLNSFVKKFDPHVKNKDWVGINDLDIIEIKPNVFVKSYLNMHRFELNKIKSFSFKVIERKKKLKKEYDGLTGNELKNLKDSGIEISNVLENSVIGYSGDTKSFMTELWEDTEILIHESTFLNYNDSSRKNHTNLEEVLDKSSELKLKGLVLSHFSSMYSNSEIVYNVKRLVKKNNIKFPVYLVLPGITNYNVLNNSINKNG